MKVQRKLSDGERSNQRILDVGYHRGMGSYRPHFQGIAQNYYPLSNRQSCYATLIVVGTIGVSLGVLIACIFWGVGIGSEKFVIIWVSIFLFFFVVSVYLLYRGGKDRRVLQKQLIQQASQKQERILKGGRKMDQVVEKF